MSYIYKTKGTCSTEIELDLDGNIVRNVKFTGGCNGNLQAIPKLVEGLTVEQVEEKIGGIKCGFKNTSCGDQLAKACRDNKLTLLYYPQLKIIHNESVSTKKSMPNLIKRKLFFLENRLDSYYVLLDKYEKNN